MTGGETISTHSAEETRAAGERLGRTLGPGDVVALTGDLGTGKTCFVQGLARGLGARIRATSPTFVLVNEYRADLPIHHVDAYRVAGPDELIDIGFLELIDGDGVTLIEWADKVAGLLPDRTIHVAIEGVGDEPRTIRTRRGAPPPFRRSSLA